MLTRPLKFLAVYLKSPRRRCEINDSETDDDQVCKISCCVPKIASPEAHRNLDTKTCDGQGSQLARCVTKIASPEVRKTFNSKTYEGQGSEHSRCTPKTTSPEARKELNGKAYDDQAFETSLCSPKTHLAEEKQEEGEEEEKKAEEEEQDEKRQIRKNSASTKGEEKTKMGGANVLDMLENMLGVFGVFPHCFVDNGCGGVWGKESPLYFKTLMLQVFRMALQGMDVRPDSASEVKH